MATSISISYTALVIRNSMEGLSIRLSAIGQRYRPCFYVNLVHLPSELIEIGTPFMFQLLIFPLTFYVTLVLVIVPFNAKYLQVLVILVYL